MAWLKGSRSTLTNPHLHESFGIDTQYGDDIYNFIAHFLPILIGKGNKGVICDAQGKCLTGPTQRPNNKIKRTFLGSYGVWMIDPQKKYLTLNLSTGGRYPIKTPVAIAAIPQIKVKNLSESGKNVYITASLFGAAVVAWSERYNPETIGVCRGILNAYECQEGAAGYYSAVGHILLTMGSSCSECTENDKTIFYQIAVESLFRTAQTKEVNLGHRIYTENKERFKRAGFNKKKMDAKYRDALLNL